MASATTPLSHSWHGSALWQSLSTDINTMVTAIDSLNPSDISRLKRLAEHVKAVHPTMCGIGMEGDFWGKQIDMRKLERLELVERKKVAHAPTLVPHFTVSAKGHEFLATASIRQNK